MKQFLLALFTLACYPAFCQKHLNVITETETRKLLATLSANDMAGRKTGTEGIEKAATFIAEAFKKAGLRPLQGNTNYLQPFTMIKPAFKSIATVLNGKPLTQQQAVAFFSEPQFSASNTSGFETIVIAPGQNFFKEAQKILALKNNVLAMVDTSFSKAFAQLPGLKRMQFASPYKTVFLLASQRPETWKVAATQQITEIKMANVVGMLPGKSRKNEMVVFSGHYDHLGIGKAVNGDSIYNGANDDASGTTAVMMLAKYFKAVGNNNRTLVFAAFTAEEIGGFGSQHFSKQMDADKVTAMFNIEMIGTESKWNRSTAYITGYEKTDVGSIMEKNLQGSGFTFYPDPYPDQQLFYRSDNATLARLGVPAHTISTSKMDNEPNYHKASDEVSTLDVANMAEIIKAIAISSASIVMGTDTPTRVKVEELAR